MSKPIWHGGMMIGMEGEADQSTGFIRKDWEEGTRKARFDAICTSLDETKLQSRQPWHLVCREIAVIANQMQLWRFKPEGAAIVKQLAQEAKVLEALLKHL